MEELGQWSKPKMPGRLGGSVAEHLPLAQVMIPASWDRVPQWAPHKKPDILPLPMSLPLSESLMNKSIKS